MTRAGLPKGDRADVRCFKSAVAKRLRAARGCGAKTLRFLFTINEPGLALTSLVNGTPMTFRSLSTHRLPGEPANPPLILIR